MIYTNDKRDVIEIAPGTFVPVEPDNGDFQAIVEKGIEVKNAPGDKAPPDTRETLAAIVANAEK